jgi:hypothetical protein
MTGTPLRLEAPLPEELVETLSRANLTPPPGAVPVKLAPRRPTRPAHRD